MTNPYSPSENNDAFKSTQDSGNDGVLNSAFPPEIPDPQLSSPDFDNPYVGGASPSVPQPSVSQPVPQPVQPYPGGPQSGGSIPDPSQTTGNIQSNGTHANVVPVGAASHPQYNYDPNMVSEAPKSWLTALLLCFFLGSFGAHNFYLGYKKRAITQLVLVVIGILTSIIVIGVLFILAVGIWAFVEFLMLLINADYRDAWGRPLVRN